MIYLLRNQPNLADTQSVHVHSVLYVEECGHIRLIIRCSHNNFLKIPQLSLTSGPLQPPRTCPADDCITNVPLDLTALYTTPYVLSVDQLYLGLRQLIAEKSHVDDKYKDASSFLEQMLAILNAGLDASTY